MKRLSYILLLFLLAVTPQSVRAQMFAIKTDLVKDLFLTPDIGIDFVVGERLTLGFEAFETGMATHALDYWIQPEKTWKVNPFWMSKLISGKESGSYEMAGFYPELKYWFNGRPFTRQYVGVVGLFSTHNFTYPTPYGTYDGSDYTETTKDGYFHGDGLGLGLSFGHVISLNKHWNIEFEGGFGFIHYRQKQYFEGDANEWEYTNLNVESNSKGYLLMPLKLGVSLVYVIR